MHRFPVRCHDGEAQLWYHQRKFYGQRDDHIRAWRRLTGWHENIHVSHEGHSERWRLLKTILLWLDKTISERNSVIVLTQLETPSTESETERSCQTHTVLVRMSFWLTGLVLVVACFSCSRVGLNVLWFLSCLTDLHHSRQWKQQTGRPATPTRFKSLPVCNTPVFTPALKGNSPWAWHCKCCIMIQCHYL